VISFATQPGNAVAGGAYTQALTAAIKRPGIDAFDAFHDAAGELRRATGQVPWLSSARVTEKFYFAGPPPMAASAPQAVARAEIAAVRPTLFSEEKLRAVARSKRIPLPEALPALAAQVPERFAPFVGAWVSTSNLRAVGQYAYSTAEELVLVVTSVNEAGAASGFVAYSAPNTVIHDFTGSVDGDVLNVEAGAYRLNLTPTSARSMQAYANDMSGTANYYSRMMTWLERVE
jgi:hypothetical protein